MRWRDDRSSRAMSGEELLVGGVPFVASSMSTAVKEVLDRAHANDAGSVRLANAYNVSLAYRDSDYKDLMTSHGVNYPDGTPVVWFMNLAAGRAVADRVRGPSLFEAVLESGVPRGTRHFFLGSTDQTLCLLQASLQSRYPGLTIAGAFSPPFGDVTDAFVGVCEDAIREANPDLVWVGLGTPKQDYVGTELARRCGVTAVSVGAAFDFSAGTVREAPRWVQQGGIEWMFRLATEPRRLWRRYLIGNVIFIVAALRSLPNARHAYRKGAS